MLGYKERTLQAGASLVRKYMKRLMETRDVLQMWLQQEKHLKIQFVVHGFAVLWLLVLESRLVRTQGSRYICCLYSPSPGCSSSDSYEMCTKAGHQELFITAGGGNNPVPITRDLSGQWGSI